MTDANCKKIKIYIYNFLLQVTISVIKGFNHFLIFVVAFDAACYFPRYSSDIPNLEVSTMSQQLFWICTVERPEPVAVYKSLYGTQIYETLKICNTSQWCKMCSLGLRFGAGLCTWCSLRWDPSYGQIPRDSNSGRTAEKTHCRRATSSCLRLRSSPHLTTAPQTPERKRGRLREEKGIKGKVAKLCQLIYFHPAFPADPQVSTSEETGYGMSGQVVDPAFLS